MKMIRIVDLTLRENAADAGVSMSFKEKLEIAKQMDTIQSASNQNSQGVDDIVEKNTNTSTVAEQMSDTVVTNKENVSRLSSIIGKFSNVSR